MRFVWRTYILPIIDYSSQLWAPQEGVLLTKLEDLQKLFTKKVEGLRNKNYWERLKILKLQSIHRRIERYKLCYTWKIIQGIVPNCGMKWDSNPRRGRRVVIPKYGQYAKKMRENSFILSAGKLFNSLPREMRDDSMSTFPVWKAKLDILLDETPDYPRSDMISPHICYISNKNSNSLHIIFKDMNVHILNDFEHIMFKCD